jgi:hypothetical protein
VQGLERQVRLAVTLLLAQVVADHGRTYLEQIGDLAGCEALTLAFDNNAPARLRQVTTFSLEQSPRLCELICERQNLLRMAFERVFSEHP